MSTANALINYDEYLAQEAEQLANAIHTPKGRSISTKGKKFRLPDETVNAGPLHVIVLDFVNINMFFTKGYTPNSQKQAPPACFALSAPFSEASKAKLDIRHEALVPGHPSPHDSSCAACEYNRWGSDLKGGKGKACHNEVRLAVIAYNATEKDEILLLKVNRSSKKAWDAYVIDVRKSYKAPPIKVITSISFNPHLDYNILEFSDEGVHSNMEVAWGMREKAAEILIQPPSLGDDD